MFGSMVGVLTLDSSGSFAPYVLVYAAAGFLYGTVSHLMPRLQRDSPAGQALPQLGMIVLGIVGVTLLIQ